MERHDPDEARFSLALDIRAAASWFRRHHFGDEAQAEPTPRRGARQGRRN
jgi:hypothetical protein